jgi:endoglucanase
MVTDSSVNDFAVIDEQGAIVRNGKLFPGSFWPLAGEFMKIGDFTDIKKPGRYQILIQETGEQEEIFIRENVYMEVLNAAVKAFYYQRLSTELKKEHAGVWMRKCGIADTACSLHASTGKTGVQNVSGGWMDAGDYGKYIVNAGITVGTMLSLYELYPDLIGDNLDIPESKNGKSDLLDEIRYELEWMKRMQDCDGGVFFKVGSLDWDGFSVMPEKLSSIRYIIGKSTSSTLNFAAVMAMAARIYKEDKEFSKDCLKRSVAAWKWAVNNPDRREPDEVGGTGAYEDTHLGDEFFWAACELFVTTVKVNLKSI